jgi:hypothetical protein
VWRWSPYIKPAIELARQMDGQAKADRSKLVERVRTGFIDRAEHDRRIEGAIARAHANVIR